MAVALARSKSDATPSRTQVPESAPVVHRTNSDRRRYGLSGSIIQTSLQISTPGDSAEREADSTARKVMTMSAPAIAPRERVAILAARAPADVKPRDDQTSPELAAAIRSQLGGGRPLPADTRSFMEPRFKADLSAVRVHTDSRAENLTTRLGARAFAYGRHIFFNAGQFQPNTPDGMELIAHELTHTIQQREVVQREVEIKQRSGPKVQRGIVSEALDWIADKANYIPGYRLFTIVIGRNPINMERVERSGANILRALIEFIPGGHLIVEALDNHGVIQKGGKFIEDQFAALGDLGAAMRDALMEFIDSLGWRDIFRLGSVWSRAVRIFSVPVDKAIAFGKNLVTGIAKLVKEAIIKPLGKWAANNIPYWDLLAGVFGKNPISNEGESPASQLIGAFMKLIGQEEIWENIKKGNAVSKAWAWFQGAMKGALSLVMSIPSRVMETISSLTIFDIVTIVGAFGKILKTFGSFVVDFVKWAGGTVLSLLEIILSVVAPTVIPYLKKAGAAFSTIIKAPGRFINTLVQAGKKGFNQFAKNIVKHLTKGLLDWLLGSLAGANLYLPQSFAPRELLKFGLSVVGLTWTNVRTKLVAATNETVVKSLEAGFDLVKTLVTEGPAAAWEQFLQNLSDLKTMVQDAIMNYVQQQVIETAIARLVMMLNPAGAFIAAIQAIYKTITFIVAKLQQIGALVAAFIDGIAAIAAGLIDPAAKRVESVLANGLSLAISFLANYASLGNISKKVIEIVNKIRTPVDKALDKVVAWVVAQAKKLGKMVIDKVTGKAAKPAGAENAEERHKNVKAAVRADLAGKTFPDPASLKSALSAIYNRRKSEGLKGLRGSLHGDRAKVEAAASPVDVVANLPVTATGVRTAIDFFFRFQYDRGVTVLQVDYDNETKRLPEIIQNDAGASGRNHAEDIFFEKHLPTLAKTIEKGLKDESLVTKRAPVSISLNLNRMPCQHCAPIIAGMAGKYPYIQFIVRGASISKSGQRVVPTDDHIQIDFIKTMLKAGVKVEPLKIYDEVWKKILALGTKGKSQKLNLVTDGLSHEVTTVRQMMHACKSETARVQSLIDEAEQQIQVGQL